MPESWKAESREHIGYVAPLTEENAEYVATMSVQKMLQEGRKPHQIALAWNAGKNAKACSKGINKYGVRFNSCHYVAMVQKHL